MFFLRFDLILHKSVWDFVLWFSPFDLSSLHLLFSPFAFWFRSSLRSFLIIVRSEFASAICFRIAILFSLFLQFRFAILLQSCDSILVLFDSFCICVVPPLSFHHCWDLHHLEIFLTHYFCAILFCELISRSSLRFHDLLLCFVIRFLWFVILLLWFPIVVFFFFSDLD